VKQVKDHPAKQSTLKAGYTKSACFGGLTFINVLTGRGVVREVTDNKDEVEKLRGLQIGTVCWLRMALPREQSAIPGGAELHEAPRLS